MKIDVDPNNTTYTSNDGELLLKWTYTSNDGVLVHKWHLLCYPGGKSGSYTVPETVTTIGQGAFAGCSNLTSVEIHNRVSSIDKEAFASCSSLTSVTIPASVYSIFDEVFVGCSSLTSIQVDQNNRKFSSEGGVLFDKDKHQLLCYPGGKAGKSYAVPGTVTSIEEWAFYGCSSLKSVTIPSGVTRIRPYTFAGCSSLMSVTISSGVTSIEKLAFALCSNLKSVEIPSSVTSIGWAAFIACNSLKSVEIPSSVTSIREYAFGYVTDESKLPGFTIYGTAGSEAYRYANDNEFPFYVGNLSKAVVTLQPTGYIYDGKAKTPAVTVTLDGKTLVKDQDYTVSYENNTKAGTAKVTVNGIGDYGGSKTVTFTIAKVDLSKAAVTLKQTSYIYDGKAKTPAVTVKLNGKTLKKDTDYTVSYKDNKKAGTAKVTVKGKGNYTGGRTVNFKIKSSITCKKPTYQVAYGAKPFKINATSKDKLTFTSSNAKVAAVDKNSGKVTIKNTGTATITVKTAKESVKVTVKVSPKKQTVKSVKPQKGKKLAVKWKKDTKATGYQVQISTSKNFKKDVISKKVTKNSKTSNTFTKLKKGKKYYVRVRSYKKSGKETLYGAWSKVKQSGKIK